MSQPRIFFHRDALHYTWWPDNRFSVVARVLPLEEGEWWIDLIRVGDPTLRGEGYGSRALRDVVNFLVGFMRADRIGLQPHALGHTHDLTSWYRRHGFTEQLGDELWFGTRGPSRQLEHGLD